MIYPYTLTVEFNGHTFVEQYETFEAARRAAQGADEWFIEEADAHESAIPVDEEYSWGDLLTDVEVYEF